MPEIMAIFKINVKIKILDLHDISYSNDFKIKL